MKFLTQIRAGQSLISWALQIIFIWLAWQVASHNIPNNLTTIIGAGVLLILTYLSLANDGKQRNNRSKH